MLQYRRHDRSPGRRWSRLLIIGIVFWAALYLAACSTSFLANQSYSTKGTFNNIDGQSAQRPAPQETPFDIQADTEQLVLTYQLYPSTTNARLEMEIDGPDTGQVAARIVVTDSSALLVQDGNQTSSALSPASANAGNIDGDIRVNLAKPGHYTLKTKAMTNPDKEDTPTGYDIYIRPEQISGFGAIILLPGIGRGIVGLLAIAISFKYRLPRSFLGIGMLLWFVAALVSIISGLAVFPEFFSNTTDLASNPLFWVANGIVFAFSYSIFVLGMAWHPRFHDVTFPHVMALALGFASMEAIIYGIFNFVNYVVVLAMPSQFKPGASDLIHLTTISANPLFGQASTWDEVVKGCIYITMVILVYYSHRTRNWFWYGVAFVYTGLSEVIQMGVLNSFPGVNVGDVAVVEGALTVWAIVGLAIAFYIARRYQSKDEADHSALGEALNASTAPVARTGLKRRHPRTIWVDDEPPGSNKEQRESIDINPDDEKKKPEPTPTVEEIKH